jgi:hypothetical protein
MNKLINDFKMEADWLRNNSPTRESLTSFILRLKNSIKELKKKEINKDILDQLNWIESFRPFDELTWIERLFQHLIIFRYRTDYYEDWKGKGKYQYDLIIKLDALLYRLERV